MRDAALACAAAAGAYLDHALLVRRLLAQVTGALPGSDPAEQRAAALALLTAALGGMPAAAAAAHAPSVCEALADDSLLEAVGTGLGGVDAALVEAVEAVLKAAPDAAAGGKPERRLLRALVQLHASGDAAVVADARDQVRALAAAAAYATPTALFAAHVDAIVTELTSAPADGGAPGAAANPQLVPAWEHGSHRERAFDALLRAAAPACGPHLGLLVPVLCRHAALERPPEVRLATLALLQTLLEAPAAGRASTPFCPRLITEALVPNIVWKAGRVASTVRKVAVACLYTLLRGHNPGASDGKGAAVVECSYVDADCAFATAPHVLPVLKTDLEDHDASTRQLVCHCLRIVFAMLPLALSQQPVGDLYPALLKRLDDSSDDVRFAACGALERFVGSAPPAAFAGTCIEYMTEQLLVHLDDGDTSIQDAVLGVLKALASQVDAKLVGRKAAAARTSHRSPAYVDRLVAHCEGC